jgi:sodium-dependent phosphate cotransporter
MLNDMFNKLSVLVLLPIEIAFHYLEETTKLVVDGIFGPDSNQLNQTAKAEVEILNAITKPFSKLIIQLDKDVLDKIAINNASTNATLIKYKCSSEVNGTKVYEDCKI